MDKNDVVCCRFISKNFGAEPVIISQTPLSISEVNTLKETMDPAPDGGCDAIAVRGAWKTFGKGDKGTPVLTNLTLTVKEGTM